MLSNLYGLLASRFIDGPEYDDRLATPFIPSKIELSNIRAVVPKSLQERSTSRSLYYVCRDVSMAIALYRAGTMIYTVGQDAGAYGTMVRGILWLVYWFFQGLTFAGCWCIAHDAGHESLFRYKWLNNVTGFILHTFLLVPFWNWRSTHRTHHKGTGSMEKDGTFVPRTRNYFNIPAQSIAHIQDYHDVFEETPIYTLLRMIFMQTMGFQAYLLTNVMGNPSLPPGTNHFFPSSPLFTPNNRNGIIASNIGLIGMVAVLKAYVDRNSLGSLFTFYLIPYLLANHWVVMLTFLHHSDPSIPHYRGKSWTYTRGALATVDRPLLGWMGRFFLHNVSHDHIAHHFFPYAPFYNLPKITEAIKPVLGADYNYDSTHTFRALYRSFTQCCFIEDDGEVLFYKDKNGVARRQVAIVFK